MLSPVQYLWEVMHTHTAHTLGKPQFLRPMHLVHKRSCHTQDSFQPACVRKTQGLEGLITIKACSAALGFEFQLETMARAV